MQNFLALTVFFKRFFKDIFVIFVIFVKISNFCVFHLILIKFGMGADVGLKTTCNEFEIATAIF